jgi:hypothetical protein
VASKIEDVCQRVQREQELIARLEGPQTCALAMLKPNVPATGPGWSACWNESPLTWITSAWCRMIRRPSRVNDIIDTAIKKIYLTAEQPAVAAVIEEVQLKCFTARTETSSAADPATLSSIRK